MEIERENKITVKITKLELITLLRATGGSIFVEGLPAGGQGVKLTSTDGALALTYTTTPARMN